MAKLKNIEKFLNNYLNIEEFSGDSAINGLSIEGRQEVKKIAFGVSCNMELFKKASSWGADAIITHHGLYKEGDLDDGIKGINKNRIQFLLKNNISLFGYHLPLDFHKELGNNVSILKKLGIYNFKQSGEYSGIKGIFSIGDLKEGVSRDVLVKKIEKLLGQKPEVCLFGTKKIKKLAVTSGKASSASIISQLDNEDVDMFLTGEISEQIPPLVKEIGLNYVAGGHYATETFGVKELAKKIKKEFKIEAKFISVKVPY